MKTRKNIQTVGIVLFMFILTFPFLNNSLSFLPDIKSKENRSLAKKPKLKFRRIESFPKKYQKYYDDHFFFRNKLSFYYSSFAYAYHANNYKKIVRGENDYLYYLKNCSNARPLDQRQQKLFKSEIKRRVDMADSLGVVYYFVIVPNKTSIMFEAIPDYLKDSSKIKWNDQVLELLAEVPGANYIDVRDALRRKKASGEKLYYKNDHHWSELGAYYGYKRIIDRLYEDRIVQEPAFSLNQFKIVDKEIHGGNLTGIVGLGKAMSEIVPTIKTKEDLLEVKKLKKKGYKLKRNPHPELFEMRRSTADTTKPKLMVIRDSFSENLMPLISRHFSESTYIWDNWYYDMQEEFVVKEKPDVLMTIIVESGLPTILKRSPLKKKKGK